MDEPFIIHAGAICSMLHLLTSVPTNSYEMAQRLQFNIINLVKNLLKFERNQQIMSSNLFIDDVLFACKHVLNDEAHFLNASIQHIFERLASHYISSKNLKQYIRSGTVFDSGGDHQVLVPLSRVKCLISMSSPRDRRQFGGVAFVEFNMMVEGFGCLFLASIAPQLSNAPSIVAMGMVSVGSDLSVNGGVGSGERVFPPQSGLSYSTWLYIDKFASTAKNLHPVRLLTLVKHSKLKDTLSSCLCVYLSAKNRSLFVNTDESLLHQFKHDEKLSDCSVKFNCSELFQEGQWLHLCIVLSRAVLKTSTVTVYVNAKLVGTQKLTYLNSIVVANGPPSSVAMHAVIGTLPMFRCQSAVVWRQAGCHLVEDILSHVTIERIYELGADYIGSFQSLEWPGEMAPSALVAEEKIVFGLHACKMFEMTLANFRRVYNKNDSKAIGKQLNIPSNESVTPLRVLSNTAVQLQGAARTVGGVVIGYMGVRVFQPMPVSKSVESLGGAGFLLALVAMATDVEFMYASVKCLACVLKSNAHIDKEMERMHGYQLLAMLYKRKKALINSHVLNLTFSLAVCDDSAGQVSSVFNVKAFECLVCDLDIWYECSAEISRCLHEKINELLLSDMQNVKLFHRLKMLKKILYSVGREGTSSAVLTHALQTIKILITECVHSDDLLTFGQFVASLVADTQEKQTSHVIELRERLLDIVDQLIAQQTTNKTYNFQEEIVKVLGFDWFVLFMNRKCVRTTVVKSAKILFTLLLNQQNLNKFITCTNNAAWLHSVNSDTSHTAIDFAHVQAIHGFQLIQANFCKYPHYVQLYYLLFALLFDAHKIHIKLSACIFEYRKFLIYYNLLREKKINFFILF